MIFGSAPIELETTRQVSRGYGRVRFFGSGHALTRKSGVFGLLLRGPRAGIRDSVSTRPPVLNERDVRLHGRRRSDRSMTPSNCDEHTPTTGLGMQDDSIGGCPPTRC